MIARLARLVPGALALAWMACAAEPLPVPFARPSLAPCLAAPPAPALVLSRPTDPGQCLSAAGRARGASVFVEVDAKGRPLGVEQVYDLCLVVGPDGRPLEDVPLDARTKSCILDHVRSWRFASFDSCARQGVVVDLPLPVDRGAFVGRGGPEVLAEVCGGGVRSPS